MATTTTSSQFSLNLKDIGKGLLLAILTPILTIVINSLNAGSLTFNWKAIAITGLSAGLAYVIKNFLSPAQIVLQNPTEGQIQAVKNGDAAVQVITK